MTEHTIVKTVTFWEPIKKEDQDLYGIKDTTHSMVTFARNMEQAPEVTYYYIGKHERPEGYVIMYYDFAETMYLTDAEWETYENGTRDEVYALFEELSDRDPIEENVVGLPALN